MILGTVSASERMAPVHGTQPSDLMRHLNRLGFLSGMKLIVRINQNDGTAAHHGFALSGKIERHDRNIFRVDVQPDVQFRPIRKRKDADALAFVDFAN